MYRIFAIILLLSNATVYAASQLIYANQNFQVIHAERKGFSDRCYMITKGSPVGSGYTYLVIYPNDILLFGGENIGDLFESATRVLLRAGDERVEIPAGSIVSGIMLVHTLMRGKVQEIVITVEGREKTVHIFPTHGFQHAYHRLQECRVEIDTKSKVQIIHMDATQ